MRDLTTTEMEHCAGGGPVNNGFARPTSASIIANDPQGDSPAPIDLTVDTRSRLTIEYGGGWPN